MKKKWKIAMLAAALALPLASGAGAAQEEGVSVQVRDGYSCAYGIDVPFTRSPRTREYTFTVYPGEAAYGEPEVTADVTIEPAGTSTVHLPLRYDPVAPSSWTLTVAAHVEEQRTGLDLSLIHICCWGFPSPSRSHIRWRGSSLRASS